MDTKKVYQVIQEEERERELLKSWVKVFGGLGLLNKVLKEK